MENMNLNTKIVYRWTNDYDETMPNNNFNDETDFIVTDGMYTFGDWLQDNTGLQWEDENGVYFALDDNDERTGEAYEIVEITEA